MAISKVERIIINKLKNTNYKHAYLINLLGFDAVKELLDDTNYSVVLKKINASVADSLVRSLIEGGKDLNLRRRSSEILAILIQNSNSNRIEKIIDIDPVKVVTILRKSGYCIVNFFYILTPKLIKRILDVSIQEKLYFSDYAEIQFLKCIVKLTDKEKIYYMSQFPFNDLELIDFVLKYFKDKDLLKEAIRIVLKNSKWDGCDAVSKYIDEGELYQFIDTFDFSSSYSIPRVFYRFSFQERIEILNMCLSAKKNSSLWFLDEFFSVLIKDVLNERNYDIMNDIGDVFNKYVDTFRSFEFGSDLLSYFDKLSPEELLSFFNSCSFTFLKQQILKKTKLWMNEVMISYLMENDPSFINKFLDRSNKDFDNLGDEIKNIFYRKENILIFIQNSNGGIENLNEEFINRVKKYFLDFDFCKKIIDVRMNMLLYILSVNPDFELFKYAVEQGYCPDKDGYTFFKDKKEFYDLWFKTLKEFDPMSVEYPIVFNSLAVVDDPEVLDILMKKSAISLNISYDSFWARFNALKSVNRDILSTFDYRLFRDCFYFLDMNKIEMIAAHRDITNKLCDLTSPELEVVKRIMSYSSDFTWVDLLDRVLNYISDYNELVLDLYNKELSTDDLNKMIMIFSRPNTLGVKNYDDLCNYNSLVNDRIDCLIKSGTVEDYKEAISLSLLGISFDEFKRINDIYCYDLDNFKKLSKNQDLINIMTLIRNVSLCDDLALLKIIFADIPRVIYSSAFLVNLDSEIRKEFTKFYNETLYHVSEKDKALSAKFKEVISEDGDVSFVQSEDGIEVSFYDPSGLMCGSSDVVPFGLMMTSLGAYSIHQEPDDYYASWNTDLIASHGFCCSYLTEDNLGTARICHACLGFTDFDMGSLLLSAPYDIGSSDANKEFNTARKKNTLFCTPRGMIDNTRHTHNEVVWERRNLSSREMFKKEPSYVVFFCENFDNLSASEKDIYNSSVKAAIQLGKDKPLPIILIDRSKIAEKNRENIIDLLNESLVNYKKGDFKKIICSYYNNRVGNTYCPYILDKYFNNELFELIINSVQMKILDTFRKGNVEEARVMYLDYCEEVNFEINKSYKDYSLFSPLEKKFSIFKSRMDVLMSLGDNSSSLYSDMIMALANMVSADCERRFRNTDLTSLSKILETRHFVDSFLANNNRDLFIEKLNMLVKLNMFVPNTPYDNRHVANNLLYTVALFSDRNPKNLDLILDAVIFHNCSYMDGREHMNLDSSLIKAEKIMKELGYDNEKIDCVKLLIILKDERTLTYEKIDKVIVDYKLNVDDLYGDILSIVPIIHDACCLDHTRFITAGELSKSYFFVEENMKFARVAYALQESYAMCDIEKYLSENIDMVPTIREMLKSKTPQEVIREIRKSRVSEKKHKNNSFEDAFLEIDVPAKTDPLSLVSKKMENFKDLPRQITLLEFFKIVNGSEYYEYLVDKIASKVDLYMSLSDIHGETHANNVSLFALYISSRKGMSERDIKTILEASIYHDIGRVSDHNDRNHGVYGAIKYGSNVSSPKGISSNEVKFLIEVHALSDLNGINKLFDRYNIPDIDRDRLYTMATVIRDADALDRTRFRLVEPTNNLDANLLVNLESKEIVESCLRLNYIIYQGYVVKKAHEKGMTF